MVGMLTMFGKRLIPKENVDNLRRKCVILKENIKEYIENNCRGDLFTKYASNVEKLCNLLGIQISEEELENQSSNIKKVNDKKFIIQLDPFNACSSGGQKYVIAHQLGHYISYMCDSFSKEKLDENKGCTWKFENNQKYCKAEQEAHMIAAYLLMPEEMVKKFIDWRIPIVEMADKFEVTLNVAKKRLNIIDPYYLQIFKYPKCY